MLCGEYGTGPYSLFANLLLLSPEEQVGDFCEVFLHNDTQTLCVQTAACEVAVVGLVVHIDGEVAIGE